MFVGHFAVGLAAKRAAPRVSLATLFLAAAFADVLWIVLFPFGIEHVIIRPGIMVANSLDLVYFPFSHSLMMDAVWGAAFAAIYFALGKDRRGAWIIFAAVVSHWVLDWATHRPDMQLAPGIDLRLGLGLWNSRAATFIVEGSLWFGAIAIYTRATKPVRRSGVYGFWAMIVLLTLLWIISLRGDPPPSLRALAITNSIFFVVLEAWAVWMNRRRVLKASSCCVHSVAADV